MRDKSTPLSIVTWQVGRLFGENPQRAVHLALTRELAQVHVLRCVHWQVYFEVPAGDVNDVVAFVIVVIAAFADANDGSSAVAAMDNLLADGQWSRHLHFPSGLCLLCGGRVLSAPRLVLALFVTVDNATLFQIIWR